MKKVKATQDYNDLKLNRLVVKGEEIEVEDDRAKTLLNANFVEVVASKKEAKPIKKVDKK